MSATPDPATETGPLRGRWLRQTTTECAGRYPVEITFSAGTTYRGVRSKDQGMIVWDAGIYRVADDQTLVVSTSSDELVSYPFRIDGDLLSIIDQDGCEVTYRRTAELS